MQRNLSRILLAVLIGLICVAPLFNIQIPKVYATQTATIYLANGTDASNIQGQGTTFLNAFAQSSGLSAGKWDTYVSNMIDQSYYQESDRRVYRSFMRFNTSVLGSGATITLAKLCIRGVNYQDLRVAVQKGTQGDTIETSDYSKFTGSYYDYISWTKTGWNTLTLNAQGISDINKTGWTYFALRDYDYDYLNVEPPWVLGNNKRSGCHGVGTYTPYLYIEYTTGAWHNIAARNFDLLGRTWLAITTFPFSVLGRTLTDITNWLFNSTIRQWSLILTLKSKIEIFVASIPRNWMFYVGICLFVIGIILASEQINKRKK